MPNLAVWVDSSCFLIRLMRARRSLTLCLLIAPSSYGLAAVGGGPVVRRLS